MTVFSVDYQRGVRLYLDSKILELQKLVSTATFQAAEKWMLEARLFLRNAEYLHAWDCLEKVSHSRDALFRAEALFLKSMIRSRQGDSQLAVALNMQAFDLYREASYRRGSFICAYNLSVDFNLLGLQGVSDYWLEKSVAFVETEDERVLVLRAKACSLSRERHYQKALTLLEEANIASLRILDQHVLNFVRVDILVRAGRVEEAYEALSALRSIKKDPELAKIKFYKILLEKLILSKKLPSLPKMIASSEMLSLKWKIICALEGGQRSLAETLWVRMAELQPQCYFAEFLKAAESEKDSLFYRVLDQSLQVSTVLDHEGCSKKLKSLLDVMGKATAPLCKEDIIEKVWGRPYSPDFDARFYKLVERAKKTARVNILKQNRTYRIFV